ncbi:MAG: NADP-dependent isocitrate dehydrogenase [Fimbriimonadaceae bacterium]|nr:NADP-dependent isocitrate dehydrogenase [Fimbriimonadaceae bacterium]
MPNVPITVAHGDGIGPEIMAATLRILEAAQARIDVETIEIGEKVYRDGITAGIRAEAWGSLRRTKVFLKSPITTPQGGGYKSLNVTVRKTLGLYANVRPCVSYHPIVRTKHPEMDVVIVRENEEDLYAGIEHRQTDDCCQTLKLVTRPGTEKIVRYAFEYARKNKRQKVTCFSKDNIMKLTDGLFHKIFDEIAAEYDDIKNEHWIIDIGSAKLANKPEQFDIIVTSNLYGDIISDIAAEITGSVGLGGSANIGESCAMFEAIHGSAPDIAGKGIANPSGLLLGAVMMLVHIGQSDVAETIHNAWLTTLEEGVHTGDIAGDETRERVGTDGFADAVIARLGRRPTRLKAVDYDRSTSCFALPPATRRPRAAKRTVGCDIFLHDGDRTPDELGVILESLPVAGAKIQMITNRGVKVWPGGMPETFKVDHWRCRFLFDDSISNAHQAIIDLLAAIRAAGLDFIKTENLCTFDGEPGYSLGQGQ